MNTDFEYLTASVNIDTLAPEQWQTEGLAEFYRAPNEEVWGATLCRTLYHETTHFWQVFSSGYVANLVAEDWRRLQYFDETGEVKPYSQELLDYGLKKGQMPFSSRELVECWARFWDIHTRGPASIIKDEGYPAEEIERLELIDPYTGNRSYTHEAFDYLMRNGLSSSTYEKPYNWLLEESKGHSAFVAITFPALVHSAFGSKDPVDVFCNAFDRAWNNLLIRESIDKRSGNINFDWLNDWGVIMGEAVIPSLNDLKQPQYTSGLDVIDGSNLREHPIYGDYIEQFKVLGGRNTINKRQFAEGPVPQSMSERLGYAIADMPTKEPWIVFGLPGQPDYRYLLGRVFTPPRVNFNNYTLDKSRPVTLRMMEQEQGIDGEEDYGVASDDLDNRVAKFRRAEYAVSVGLPVNAFE